MSNPKEQDVEPSPSEGAAVPPPPQQQQGMPAMMMPGMPTMMMPGMGVPPNMVPAMLAQMQQTTQSEPPPPPTAPVASGGKHKAGFGARFKKAPDAPKRFKSAFIIYSAEKHKKIKEKYAAQGRTEKTTDIAKVVSQAWREMDPEEREIWEERARQDKARYEMERSLYKGPWKVPANKRTPKDPSAPKRPMSAFLAFSNKRRAGLKRETPDATNADLSKMLSKQWKSVDPDVKKKYMDEEADLRAKYKVAMSAWRKKVAEEKKAERKEREAMAMQAAEARQNEQNAVASGQQPQQGQTPQDMNASGGGFPNPAMYGYGMPNQAPGSGGEFSGANMPQGTPGFPNAGLMANPFAAQQLLGGAAAQLQQIIAQQQLMQQQGQMGQRGMGMFGQGMQGAQGMSPGQQPQQGGTPNQGSGQGTPGFQGFPAMQGGDGSQQPQVQGGQQNQMQPGMLSPMNNQQMRGQQSPGSGEQQVAST